MRQCLVGIVLAWVSATSAFTVSTNEVSLTVEGGVVTALTNRLTGESLRAPGGELHGLWRQDRPGAASLVHGAVAEAGTTVTDTSPFGTATTTFAAEGAEVQVTHAGRSTAPGLRGVQWGLVVPKDCAIHVPAHSGLRLDADSATDSADFRYPQAWECQFVLIQTKAGGFLIQATDDLQFYKVLRYRRRADRFELGFETQAPGPFATATSAPGTTWRIRAYRGEWTVGAGLYREWATRTFRPVPVTQQRPAWVKDVQAVWIGGLEPALLSALAARLNPAQTILYVPSWRKDSYDRNYPDYTPAEGFPEQVRRAQALGFRVMLHVNYFGCTLENPEYQDFQRYHLRRSSDGQLDHWDWRRSTPPIKFAYINPAAKLWRQRFVDKMREVVRVTGCDSLHLDQTLCIDNDQNGLIDGLNMMQGAAALHRELREALPDVAISGEGLNEVTGRWEAFAQRHLRGLHHSEHTWAPAQLAEASAVSSAVLRPFTAIYGYLGYTTPVDTPYFLAWQVGYENFGVLPTLKSVSPNDLSSSHPAVEQVIREARFFQANRPVPVFEGYGESTRFAWRTTDGRRVAWTNEGTGARLACGDEVLARRISGVTEIRVPGQVLGAVAWDADRFFGLDPQQNYLWSPEPPPADTPRVTAADRPVVMAGRLDERISVLSLRDPAGEIDLQTRGRQARSGVRLRDGQTFWEPGLGLAHASGAGVQRRGNGFFAHPPWKEDGVGAATAPAIDGLGHTVIEFTLPLPADQPVRLETAGTIDSGAKGQGSDGATFRVTARAGDLLRQAEVLGTVDEAAPLTLDLAPFAGRTVTLTLETTPGPAGSVTFDWALWIQPRLLANPRPVTVTAALPRAPVVAIDSRGGTPVRPVGGGRFSLSTQAPGMVYLSGEAPAAVRAGTKLLDVEPTCLLAGEDGVYRPPSGFMTTARTTGVVGGVEKPSWSTHPPAQGRNETYFAVRLPDQPLRLTGLCGLGDNNQSKGVGFRVRVGDAELWRYDAPGGPMTWQPVDADLAAYRGRTVMLVLVADSLGPYDFDWARWADLTFTAP